jgi:DNA polymerase III epsilon subunit-like protein
VTDDLLFFDCESTGPDPFADRLTEVSVVRADGTVVFASLVNPGRPIPEEVQRLTGITDELVADAWAFESIAPVLADVLRDKPLAGFGCTEFDTPLLAEEFERAGVGYSFGPVLDVGHLYKMLRPRNLAAAVLDYRGRNHAGAHRATADAVAVVDVLDGMLLVESRVRAAGTFPSLIAIARGGRPERADPAGRLLLVNGVICYGTHRNRGVPVADDVGYGEWMLRQDFPLSTRRVLRAELDRLEAEAAVRIDGQPVPAAVAVEIPF